MSIKLNVTSAADLPGIACVPCEAGKADFSGGTCLGKLVDNEDITEEMRTGKCSGCGGRYGAMATLDGRLVKRRIYYKCITHLGVYCVVCVSKETQQDVWDMSRYGMEPGASSKKKKRRKKKANASNAPTTRTTTSNTNTTQTMAQTMPQTTTTHTPNATTPTPQNRTTTSRITTSRNTTPNPTTTHTFMPSSRTPRGPRGHQNR